MRSVPSVDIVLTNIVTTGKNPRVVRKTDPGIQELAATIKRVGIIQPVIVRKYTAGPPDYELVAGERRVVASRVAGEKTIPAIVRDLTDDEFIDIVVIENMAREDLTPLEEARGIQSLVSSGRELKEIAANLGQTVVWVARRAKLTKLLPVWVELHRKPGSEIAGWGAGHLECIAVLPTNTQRAFHEKAIETGDCWPSIGAATTIDQLEAAIAAFTRKLSGAPWRLDAPNVGAKTPTCQECLKRTGAQPTLDAETFAVRGDPKKLAKKDRCLDGKCWAKKLKTHMRQARKLLKEEHGDTVLSIDATKHWSSLNTAAMCDVTRCKKTAKGAIPAMVVKGTGTGRVLYVTWKKGKKPAKHTGPSMPGGPSARDQAETSRRREIGRQLSKRLNGLKPEDIADNQEERTRIALVLANVRRWDVKTLRQYSGKTTEQLVADIFKDWFRSWNLNEWQMTDGGKKQFSVLCKFLRIPFKEIEAEANTMYPMPAKKKTATKAKKKGKKSDAA